ncbi:MAG: hypothetical protein KJ574_03510 [Nanoarchaeota archaeon]|nr:hypothetical protein [Nanoarchaeota archaeon]
MIWVVEKYLIKYSPQTKFYFIHIPQTLTQKQKKLLKDFINTV